MTDRPEKVTTRSIVARKGRDKIAMLTAYDYPTAVLLDGAGVDIILVGDSLGMVVLGHEDTLQVTVDMIAYHTRAVTRGRRRALAVADMPFLSYHTTLERAVDNAGELIRAGAEAVKIEGGRKRVPVIEALLRAEIPVMGHVGLTPQSVHAMGGFKVQAREVEDARELIESAKALEQAGVFCMVLEGVPEEVARAVTDAVAVPTIGIGAGPGCDGQVLVLHDMLGIGEGSRLRFVRRYAELGKEVTEAVRRYVADVREGGFPGPSETYHLNSEAAREFESR
jgi:3-methyl-2-oxobutanoate hydroxymethyltransferase